MPGNGEQCSNLENARKFLSYELGSGKKIVLGHDHWHPDGILNERYGPRVIYIYIYATSLFEGRVDFVLRNKHWVQKAARPE